jgi:uncharacterized protein YqgC (DUF456 family)
MVLGLLGTVLPALPGVVLVFLGIWLGAWIGDYQQVSSLTVAILAVLTVLAWALDYVAALLGARGAGASRQALVGAALGTVAGVFMGLVGVLFMPFVGAVVGEYLARGKRRESLRVGLATWLGLIAGLMAKVVIAFMMIGIFVVALVF